MRIYAISDLHLASKENKPMEVFGGNWENHWQKIKDDWDSRVKDDDVVLIAGDISWAIRLESAVYDLEEIGQRKGKKILIKGNHDYWWSSLSKLRAVLPEGMYVLQNDAIKIGNTIFAGSRGWTTPDIYEKSTEADTKIYLREVERFKLSLGKALSLRTEEDDNIIAMTHFPPFNSRFENSAFTDLFEEYGVKTVVYGHLHGYTSRIKEELCKKGVNYYLTACDKLDFKLLEIEKG